MIFQKKDVAYFQNKYYLFTYFLTRRPKNIFNAVFTYHNDIFSKNECYDYPYGVTFSKFRSKQVLIFERVTPKDNHKVLF